jgi:hypothetical protein
MTQFSENPETTLCERCIGNRLFAGWIVRNGRKGQCEFDLTHGTSDSVVSVEAFAEEVDRYFRETYQLGEEYIQAIDDSYDTYGEPFEDILANDLECDQGVLSAIIENLPDCSHHDIVRGAEPFYRDKNYEPIVVAKRRHLAEEEERWYENRFAYQWEEFCEIVQYRRRFFKIKELLDDLFGRPEEYEGGTIRPVYFLEAGQKIFRARILDDQFTFDSLRQNPAMELNAPPRDKARAGRMNVEYIPAFYAAFSEQTAIAELRPSISDQVAVGTFVLQKNVRVFDFTAFSRPESDWKELRSHTRYEFITQMEDEISKPVRAFEKQREYIATQVVSEYLREYFDCDAVIYKSSMVKGNRADNRNIVIHGRDADFVGTAKTLMLARHDIWDIGDIIYEIFPGIPF